MCSGRALTRTAIVPEYVGSTMRLSPAMTRVRSDGVAPQRAIQRRPGNQYSTASARITKSVGNMRPPSTWVILERLDGSHDAFLSRTDSFTGQRAYAGCGRAAGWM